MRARHHPFAAWFKRSLPTRPLPPERQRYFQTLSRLYLIAIFTYVLDLVPMFWLLGDKALLGITLAGLAGTLIAREVHRRGYMGSAVLLLLTMMTAHMFTAIGVYGSGQGFELYFALIMLIIYISDLSQGVKLLVSAGLLALTAWQLMTVGDAPAANALSPLAADLLLVANLTTVSLLFGVILRQLEGITERLELNYRRQANHDALTGVYNRRAMLAEVERAQASGTPFALLMLDIDHFKRINDRYGHKRGDRALCHVVECLRLNMREEDMLGRYGGEEFIAVLRGMSHDEAMGIARRLIAGVRETPYWLDVQRELTLTLSAGVAVNGEVQDIDALVAMADRRLYAAKRSGRDRVCGRDDEMAEDGEGAAAEASRAVMGRAAEEMRMALGSPGRS
ncbi:MULTISPECIES: GGDEF domain-containing protein [unclassified Modicisalibacter]|uniref:GGDEF domain-containing protein n=1 Tax=unclassified Modicisalibacter TaxID=2679913 RepID=UPI001CCD4E9C|nr:MULTISPECIES: GGDEF domain-containing protein [unclassified Modicisalibacter]MBZ9559508.1 GGDEF domain-containing protein [Modicisalibacter sp. R2A 31.J]MBZ9576960.1 GGDEF domain-containing protein [Modicisalibacter sp. MOD 31.J]